MTVINNNPQLIWGIKDIASLIGRTYQQTAYMAAKGKIPVKKVGERYVAERGQLIEFLTTPDAPASKETEGAA